jgi:hypothetical protein
MILFFTTEEEIQTMKIVTLVSRMLVIIAAFCFILVAFNLVSSTSSASSCIPYKNGNGSHLRYKGHTYSYGHVGKVAATDIIMNGTCPIDGIPVIANQTTQNTTPIATVSSQTSQAIDKDREQDENEHGKKSAPHKIATENTANNQTNNTTTNVYNTYNSYATSNVASSNDQEIDTSNLQIDTSVPVGLYELER